MHKNQRLESKDLINEDFATSTYYGKQPLTEKELITKLERNYTIYRRFIGNGYIISKEFSFITRATFDQIKNSELDFKYHGEKTKNQKEQAIKMCKIVEDYFNSFDSTKNMKVVFTSRSDSECALYDESKFDTDEINRKLVEAFK